MKKYRFIMISILLGTILWFSSCVTAQYIPAQVAPAKKVVVVSENVRIEAVDSSFVLESGKAYDTPFASKTGNINFHLASKNISSYYQEAMDSMNAKPVRVYREGREKPYYGVLLFSYLFPNAQGPVASSYSIQISSGDFSKITAANTVAVYEYYAFNEGVKYSFAGESLQPKSWILWLSEVPLW